MVLPFTHQRVERTTDGRPGHRLRQVFRPIHLQLPYKDKEGITTCLPATEHESVRCLALPFFNRLRDEQIAEVCDTLLELMEDAKKIRPALKATGR